MKRIFISVITAACLAGCYVPNREEFERSVHETISIGMPLSEAIDRLATLQLACESKIPTADHRLTCARERQRLWPSSCIERVNLRTSAADNSVRVIEVPPIRCTGL
jgi:hypothetical protein